MAARRSALIGISAWEREEKAHQQRDYAAQLQEQILQKQVRLEQEKARRQQEQRDELEIIERERATANRQRHEHQKTELSLQVSSSSKHTITEKSSTGVESQQHGPFMVSALEAIDSSSDIPTESSAEVATADPFQHNTASGSMSSFKFETYTPAFSSAPSVFESLIREPGIGARSIAFYENLTNLQKLCTELEVAAAQKRREVQDCYAKPNFNHYDDDHVSLSTALRPLIQIHDNDGSQDEEEIARVSFCDEMSSNDEFLGSSLKGLHGESVLLPLTKAKKSLDFSKSEAIEVSLATLSQHPMEPAYDGMTLDNCLVNQSEMLPFSG